MQLLHLQHERFPAPELASLNLGFQHLVVPKDKFTLETSWDAIKTYTFGTGIAKHYFCGTCGISPFYVPRSNPNSYSVRSPRVNADGRSTFVVSTKRNLKILYGITLMDRTGRMHSARAILENELKSQISLITLYILLLSLPK
jgi:hypothetical protein